MFALVCRQIVSDVSNYKHTMNFLFVESGEKTWINGLILSHMDRSPISHSQQIELIVVGDIDLEVRALSYFTFPLGSNVVFVGVISGSLSIQRVSELLFSSVHMDDAILNVCSIGCRLSDLQFV